MIYCSICAKVFDSRQDYEIHLKCDHGAVELPFGEYGHDITIDDHQQEKKVVIRFVRAETVMNDDYVNQQQNTCPICATTSFNSPSDLKDHIQSHGLS